MNQLSTSYHSIRTYMNNLPLISLLCGLLCLFIQPMIFSGKEPLFDFFMGGEFLVITMYVIITCYLRERNLTEPYLFFFYTTILFIGGRFVASFFGVDASVFSDFYFADIKLLPHEKVNLMCLINAALLFIHSGYIYMHRRDGAGLTRYRKDLPVDALIVPASIILIVATLCAVVGITEVYKACLEWGYIGLYKKQGADNLIKLSSIGQYGLLLGMGLAFCTNNKKLQWSYIVIIGLYFILYLFFGLRSGFLAYALFFSWFYNNRIMKLNVVTFVLLLCFLFIIAQLFITVGFRATNGSTLTKTNGPTVAKLKHEHSKINTLVNRIKLKQVGWFAYLQGSSLVYTGAAFRINSYPWQAYAQSVIPGFSQLYLKFSPHTPISSFYFSHYLAKKTNEKYYNKGYAIGWSIFSDFKVFSFSYRLLYPVLPFFLGVFFYYISRSALSSAFYRGALACVLIKLILLPRTGLYSIIPFLITYSLLVYFFRITPLFISSLIKQIEIFKLKYSGRKI